MAYRLLRALFRGLFRVTIDGVTDQFKHEKLIITPNHVSFLDGALLALFLRSSQYLLSIPVLLTPGICVG